MRKFGLVLSLMLVLVLSGVVMASFPSETIEFKVHISPWVQMEVTDHPELLKVLDGSAEGKISAFGKIAANTPFSIRHKTTRILEIEDDPGAELGNWFYYNFLVGENYKSGGNPGGGALSTAFPAGTYDFEFYLELKSTHFRGSPQPREWYSLLAGDYEMLATITIEVEDQN